MLQISSGEFLDPAVSRFIGQRLQALAAELIARASATEAEARAHHARRQARAAAKAAAGEVERLVGHGRELEAAIDTIANRREIDPAQVRAWFEIAHKKPAARMRIRNVKIMRLAAKGWSDAEIARKFRMHSKSVNRIVRRMLRAPSPPNG